MTYLRIRFCGALALITVFSYAAESAKKPTLRDTLRDTVIPDFSQKKQPFINILAELQSLSKTHNRAGKGIKIYYISRNSSGASQVDRALSPVRKTDGQQKPENWQGDSFGGKRDLPELEELSISMTSASVWDILEQLSALSLFEYIIEPKLGGVIFLEGGCLPPFSLSVYEVKGNQFSQSLEQVDFEKRLGYHGINFHKGKYVHYRSYCRYHKPSGRLLVYYDRRTTYQIEKVLNIEPIDEFKLNRGPFDPSYHSWLEKKLPRFQVTDVPPQDALRLLQKDVLSEPGGNSFSYVLPNNNPDLLSGNLTLDLTDTDVKTVLDNISDAIGIDYRVDNRVVLYLPYRYRLHYKAIKVDPSIFEGVDKNVGFNVMEWFEQFGVTFPTLSSGEASFAAYHPTTQTLTVMTTRGSQEDLQDVILKLTPDNLETRSL